MNRKTLLPLMGLLAGLLLYYWGHKPVDIPLLATLFSAALSVAAVVALVSAAAGCGRWVMGYWQPHPLASSPSGEGEAELGAASPRPYTPPQSSAASQMADGDVLAVQALLGLGILSVLSLALGLLGLYQRVALFVALLLVYGVVWRQAWAWLRGVRLWMRLGWAGLDTWTRWLVMVTLALLGMALVMALAPPTAFDALNYHLASPMRYLRAGQITAQPDHFFSGFPQGVEVLYAWLIGLVGLDSAAAPLHFAFGLLGIWALGGVLTRYAGATAAWTVAALLMSAYSLWVLFGWPYVDLALFAYSAAGLAVLARMREPHPQPLSESPQVAGEGSRGAGLPRPTLIFPLQEVGAEVLLGMLAGFALGVKYTGVGILAAMVLAAWLFADPHPTSPASGEGDEAGQSSAPSSRAGRVGVGLWSAVRLKRALIIPLVAALAFLPWAVKGLLLYQNPLYPFLFGGLNWDAGRAMTFSTPNSGLLAGGQIVQWLLMPFAATAFGAEKGDSYSFSVGAWLLTAPFLLLFTGHNLSAPARRLAWLTAVYALPLYGLWWLMAGMSAIGLQTRLAIGLLPPAAVLAALAFHSLPIRPLNVRLIGRALLALSLVFALVEAVRHVNSDGVLDYLLGQTERPAYRDSHIGAYTDAMRLLNDLPAGSQIRVLYEAWTYDCAATVTCLPDVLFDYWVRALRSGLTPTQVFAAWRAAGDDYVLVYETGYEFNRQDSRFLAENALFPDALKVAMNALWTNGVYTLYGWK